MTDEADAGTRFFEAGVALLLLPQCAYLLIGGVAVLLLMMVGFLLSVTGL